MSAAHVYSSCEFLPDTLLDRLTATRVGDPEHVCL